MPKKVTKKQQRFLFSKGSPLTKAQKARLANELRRKRRKKRK